MPREIDMVQEAGEFVADMESVLSAGLEAMVREVRKMERRGMDAEAIITHLEREIDEGGGRILGTLMNAMDRRVGEFLGTARLSSLLLRWTTGREKGRTARYQWIAVLDSHTCAECAARHGIVHTLAEWEDAYGLPNETWPTGGPTCEIYRPGSCRCYLVPVAWVDESLERPIFLGGTDTTPKAKEEILAAMVQRPSFDADRFFKWLAAEGQASLAKQLKQEA